jgi:hypothetical protein
MWGFPWRLFVYYRNSRQSQNQRLNKRHRPRIRQLIASDFDRGQISPFIDCDSMAPEPRSIFGVVHVLIMWVLGIS